MAENIYLFLVTTLSFFVKIITGFGNTLVMSALFSFVVGNKFTTPVDLLLSIPTNSYMVWKSRKEIKFKSILPVTIMMLIGSIVGILLLGKGNDTLLRGILGIILMGLAIEMLLRKPIGDKPLNNKSIIVLLLGLISGIITGLYGIGALLAAYIGRFTSNKNEFRGSLCFLFLIDNLFRLVGYIFSGIINLQILLSTLYLIPAVILGMFIGTKLDHKFSDTIVKKFVIILLFVSGMVLCIKNLL